MSTMYAFRPLRRADLMMVTAWLNTPEVKRWLGDPVEQASTIAEDLGQPLMRQWIVEHEGRAFAYVQAYPARDWPQSHMMHLPVGSQAIDAFIGEPAMLGCGHGSAMLHAFASMLLEEGAPVIAIDPDVANQRAQRAYSQAGFVRDKVVATPDGDVVLMTRRSPRPTP